MPETERIPANQSPADLAYFTAARTIYKDSDPDSFPLYASRQSIAKFLTKYELMRLILGVHGSIVECGVLHGAGTLAWAKLSSILEPANHTRKVIGFDTFSGFTSITESDTYRGTYAITEGALRGSSKDQIEQAVHAYDLNRPISHIPKVELIAGDICATASAYMTAHPHTVISLLYLDCDLYAPTKAALTAFLPRMPKGAIIVFDELASAAFLGETQAVHEVLGLNNLKLQRFPFDSYVSYAIL